MTIRQTMELQQTNEEDEKTTKFPLGDNHPFVPSEQSKKIESNYISETAFLGHSVHRDLFDERR